MLQVSMHVFGSQARALRKGIPFYKTTSIITLTDRSFLSPMHSSLSVFIPIRSLSSLNHSFCPLYLLITGIFSCEFNNQKW